MSHGESHNGTLLGAVALLVMCAPEGGAAQPRARRADPATILALRAELTEGIRLFSVLQTRASMTLLQKVVEGAQRGPIRGRALMYLALNHLVLQDRTAATSYFERALHEEPTLTLDRERFKPADVNLFEQLRGALYGTLQVRGGTPGVQVHVDGELIGKLPLTQRLSIGRHAIEIRAARDQRLLKREAIVVGIDATVTLDATRYGSLSITSTPSGAQVFVDGIPFGVTPLHRARVPSGAHHLVLERAGYKLARTTVVVTAEGEADLTIALSALSPRRVWTIVAAGGALAAFVAGSALSFAVLAAKSDYESLPAGATAEIAATEEAAGTQAHAATAMYCVAGTLAAGTALLYWLEGRSVETASQATRGGAHASATCAGPTCSDPALAGAIGHSF